MLFRLRQHLNPRDTGMSTSEIDRSRRENPVVAEEPIAFFALYYEPKYWFWETINMGKRLLLTCVVVICRTLAQTTVL